MFVEYDTEAQATYLRISKAAIVRTRTIDETVLVDLDAEGNPVGVELLTPPRQADHKGIKRLMDEYPNLADSIYEVLHELSAY